MGTDLHRIRLHRWFLRGCWTAAFFCGLWVCANAAAPVDESADRDAATASTIRAAAPVSMDLDTAEPTRLERHLVYGIPIGIAVLAVTMLLWNVLLMRLAKARTRQLQQELAERRKTEASLLESRRHLAMIMNNLQGVVYRILCQPEWSLEFVAQGALELTGYTAEDFLQQRVKWQELVVPEDRDRFRETVDKALRNRQMYQLEYQIVPRDGQLKWILDKGRGVFDEDGKLVAQEGFVLDISYRKKIEEKLRRQERQLAGILKAAPVGIGLLSNRVFVRVNDQVCTMTGYHADELINQNARMLYRTQEDYDYVGVEKYRQIRETGLGTVETRWRCKNGRMIDVLLSSTPLDADDLDKGVIFTVMDITEAKTARQTAIAERDRAQQYLDIAGVMIVVLDVEGCIQLLNKKGCDILECTESRVRGKDWFSVFLPESSRKAVRKAFCDLITGKGGTVESFENAVRTTSGKEKLIAWHNTVIRDEEGTIVGTLSSGLDITEQRNAEKALQLTRFAVDHAGEGAFLINSDGYFEYVNRAACESLGYTADELLTMSISDIDPTYSMEFWPQTWDALRREKVRRFETLHRRKDGTVFPVAITSNYLCYEGRELHCAFARDISERKATEEALQFTQFAVDHAGDDIFWTNPDAQFVYVNDKACQVLGYSREELLNMTVPDIDPYMPRHAWEAHWEEMNRKRFKCFEMVHRTKDGRMFPVEISANYIEYGDNAYICAIARDISERKAAEAAQQKLMRELQSKNEELEGIVFIASHDLRSPLVNIRGFTGELEKSLSHLQTLLADEQLRASARGQLEKLFDEEIAESIGFINAGNRKMDMLLKGLLRLSRVGTAQVSLAKLDMRQLFEGILNNFRFRIRHTDIEITVDESIPPCRGDAALLNQVFNNLIENAIKYRSPDRPARIHISAEPKDETVVYCVHDNGIGIAPEHVDKVFEIFHRLNPTGDQDGEGLGLTIVRRLLKRQDGQIRIASEPGAGTSVFVELPKA